MQPRINVLGAGIAGLSLAAQLRSRSIACQIFDRTKQSHGHNYGLTLSVEELDNLSAKFLTKTNAHDLRKAAAVDRLIGGNDIIPQSSIRQPTIGGQPSIIVQDSAFRHILASDQHVSTTSRLRNIKSSTDGIELAFDDGTLSTASMTIDASGEQSPLIRKFLPDVTPEVLAYAVYHGSRYLPSTRFEKEHSNLFEHGENIREWTIPAPTTNETYFLQLKRSYITFTEVPSTIRDRHQNQSSDTNLWVEIRYTLSRPARSNDPLFNANRTRDQAKIIPEELYTELSTLVSSRQPNLPLSVSQFLDDEKVKQDKIQNWLMRVRRLTATQLKVLAEQGVLVIGDAAHALPILGSQGACVAMSDADYLADWLDEHIKSGSKADLFHFYDKTSTLKRWDDAEARSRAWLRDVHGQVN